MFKKIRPLVIVNFVVLYVFASYGWWSILLLNKNEESYQVNVKLLKKQVSTGNSTYITTDTYKQLKKRYEAQRLMIISEGSVYILLLIIGAWQIRKSFRKEMELNRQQRNFLLSITHELKSPLASTKASLQTLSMHKDLTEVQSDRLLKNSMDDMDRLQKLVENILFASKIESDHYRLPIETFGLSVLAEETYSKFLGEYGNSRKLSSKIEKGITIQSNRMAISSVLLNILENAVKYSDKGTTISLEVKKISNLAHIIISDEGIGVSDEEKRKIFQKFYRVGTEETRRTQGTGLGLFIVDKIVKMYHGSITVSNNTPKGSIFEMTIPTN
jgi:two-component system, OmpR family, phosphate regulon sensor histidine kinase PhoR